MKKLLFILAAFISCGTKSNNPTIETASKIINRHIDKTSVSKIELLIIDTSVINLPSLQLTPLIEIGEGQSFVDSFGRPLHAPTQKIVFENHGKDSLIDLLNSFLVMPKQEAVPTTCIIIYGHVFLLYDLNDKIAEQVDLSFDCPMLNYLHRGIVIHSLEENNGLFNRLVGTLKSVNAFIPEYGPPSSP